MFVCTLGDLLLDVIVRLDAPLAADDDAPATTHVGAGGQAANVAAWVVELGGRARLVAKHGDDAAGWLVRDELAGRGVEVVGPGGGRTGIVVSLVGAGTRTMASDRATARQFAADELDEGWFEGCAALHISGYVLIGGPVAAAAERAATIVRRNGGRVSVDLAAAALLRPVVGDVRERLVRVAPDVVFGTEAEWEVIGPELEAQHVVKRGEDGIVVDGRAYAANSADAVDTTGAGDALAAGFLLGGPELGLDAAARCVAKLGSLP